VAHHSVKEAGALHLKTQLTAIAHTNDLEPVYCLHLHQKKEVSGAHDERILTSPGHTTSTDIVPFEIDMFLCVYACV
jgi:hypothetical protein